MDGLVDSPAIKPINKGVIHRICSGQVILDLSSAVKELVENSLDAGASSIEISLREYGEESMKVSDNGCGISPNNFQGLALKHHTSKIADFSDLQSLTSFGFRGEALSSLCALGDLTVETRTKNEPVGTRLTFDHSGLITCERKTARQIGTTVTVEKLFSTLPVRFKEFSRNIRREYGKLISLLNAYALIAKGVRLVCTNTTGRNSKSVVLKTQGSSSLKDNIISIFGSQLFTCLEPLNLCLTDSFQVEGFLSKPAFGSGRSLGDRQFFYVNGRPVDMPKLSKLVNEFYKSSNSRQYPIAIMNFTLPTKEFDVNLTPDKRKIFFSDESSLMLALREAIEKIYSPSHCSYSINDLPVPKKETDSFEVHSPDEETHAISKPTSPEGSDGEKDVCSENLILEDIPDHIKVPKDGVQDSYKDKLFIQKEGNPSLNVLTQYAFDDTNFSNSNSTLLRTSTSLITEIDKHTTSRVRTAVKSSVENLDSPSRLNLVQSSLAKFLSVNKRKREDCSSLLSEMPVLRKELVPCQVKKASPVLYAAPSRSVSSHCDDTSTKASKKEHLEHLGAFHSSNEVEASPSAADVGIKACLEDSGAFHDSNEVEASVSANCNVNDGGSEQDILKGQEEVLPFANVGSKVLSHKELESVSEDLSAAAITVEHSNTIFDTTLTDSGLGICSVLEFNIDDLRTRWCQRVFRSDLDISTHERIKIKRCYNAATLESSQPENEEAKARALAAATTELERSFSKEDFGRMKVIGQFNLGFIIGKLDQDLFIIDQHAADEKYNFERLSQSTILNQQPLLQPMRLELSPEEEVIVSLHMDIFRNNGFTLMEDMHAPPGHRYLLKAVPFSKNMTFGAEDVKELISILSDSQGECSIISSYRMDTPNSICPSRIRAMLASRACRSSIMIGDPLNRSQMQKILKHLANLKSPWNCPHGRPTMRHLVDLSTVHDSKVK